MEPRTVSKRFTQFIKEGQAEIGVTTDNVFYNPVQEFNRDLSVAVLTTFIEDYKTEKIAQWEKKSKKEPESGQVTNGNPSEIDVTILEALSATGLRSIRYAKEVPNVTKIVANDLSKQAVQIMKANIIHNQVEDIIEAKYGEANMLMYQHSDPAKKFCAIDLDPYGCPAKFLDAAIQCLQNGGLLLVTATDMAILAGNSPSTCYTKYGAISLKTKCCHEMALRILLQCIEKHANTYGRYTVPLLSISVDFYIRVFVKVYFGPAQCKKTLSKLSMVYHCMGCDNITLQQMGGYKKPNSDETNHNQIKVRLVPAPSVDKNCIYCNEGHQIGGPIWSAPIHDIPFVSRVLAYVETFPSRFGTAKRIQGILSMIVEELHDVPLYYSMDKMFGRVHLETMPMMTMRSAILNAGYNVSYSHASKMSVKTDAPAQLIWDIVRTWAQTHPAKQVKLEADPIAKFILNQEIQNTIDLTHVEDANPISRRNKQLRFQFNPEPFWGPGARAAINVGENIMTKAKRNQNKKSKNGETSKRQHPSLSEEEESSSKKSNSDT